MAIEDDLDPRLLADFVKQMQETGTITEELRKQIDLSTSSFAKFRTKALNQASEGLKQVGGASKDLATSLASGDRSFKVLDSAVDLTAGAFKGLLGFIPGVKGFTNAIAGASKILIGEMEKQVNGFQSLGEVGALTERGVEGFQESVLASGLTLDDYTKRIASSSKTLARFQGLTATGAETFAEITRQLTQDTDVSLRRLGLSAEQMGESTEAFLTRQTRLGLSQGLTATQLAASTTSYIKELDLLSKVTGQSRKSIQDQQDAALSETRFRASMEGLRGTAEEGSINKMMNFQSTISDMDADLGQGVRDLASGFTATEAARRAEFVTGGRASQIMDRLRKGQIGELEARQQMQKAVIDNREQLIFAGRALGDTASIVGNTAGLFDFMNATIDENGKFVKQATEAQKGQVGGANALTNNLVDTQQSLERAQIEIQKLFFTMMPAASEATKLFTDGMKTALVTANNFFADFNDNIKKIANDTGLNTGGTDQDSWFGKFTGDLIKKLGGKVPGNDNNERRRRDEKDKKVNEILKNLENKTKEPVKNLSTIKPEVDPAITKAQREKENLGQTIADNVKDITKASSEAIEKVAVIQSTSEAYKNLLAAGIKPEPANVKMAQLSGIHDAGKLASANENDLVSNVFGLDAVQQFGVHRIGDLKNTLANLDLAGPKEQYSSTVADMTPTIDETTTEAVIEANNKLAQSGDKTVEAINVMSDKMDILIAAATKGNNINRYNGRASLA